MKRISSALVAPGACWALVTDMFALSYQPRAANAPSAKLSWNSTAGGGGGQLVTDRTTAPTSGLVTEVTRSPLPGSQRFIRARATPRAPTWVPAGPSENVAT